VTGTSVLSAGRIGTSRRDTGTEGSEQPSILDWAQDRPPEGVVHGVSPGRPSAAEESATHVLLHPLADGRYNVTFGAETIVSRSHNPEHDAARALAGRGVTGGMVTLDPVTRRPRMVFPDIKEMAGWIIEEGERGPRRRRWRGGNRAPAALASGDENASTMDFHTFRGASVGAGLIQMGRPPHQATPLKIKLGTRPRYC
jgi:hypothetical protein